MAWLGSDAALVALATATVLEVSAYYVPWLDNLLDAMATPAAIVAGVMAWAAVTPELSPLLRWTLAIVAGGGAAGLVQSGTACCGCIPPRSRPGSAIRWWPPASWPARSRSACSACSPRCSPRCSVVLVLVGLGAFYRRATSRRNAAPYSKP